MGDAAIETGFILLIFAIITIGLVLLQLFLSKNKNKWLGLLLPSLSFLISLILALSSILPNGISRWDAYGLIAITLLLANIPTAVLLIIYFICRQKIKSKKEIDIMNVQDLE